MGHSNNPLKQLIHNLQSTGASIASPPLLFRVYINKSLTSSKLWPGPRSTHAALEEVRPALNRSRSRLPLTQTEFRVTERVRSPCVDHLLGFWVPIEIRGRSLVRWKALVKAYMPVRKKNFGKIFLEENFI